MNDWQKMVTAFHEKFGIPARDPAQGWLSPRCMLRAGLINEEAHETVKALADGDMAGVVDGLCDTIYVCIGAAVEMGIDLEPFFAEVHRTNMLKESAPFRADGKLLKPEGWKPPRIAEMMKELP